MSRLIPVRPSKWETTEMSDRMLKVKACEHTSRTLVFASTSEQCNTCGAVIHDYRYGGGLRSPNYPIVRESPLLEPFLAVCQQLIEAERMLGARGMSCTPDLDMIRLAKENERLRLDLEDAARRLVSERDAIKSAARALLKRTDGDPNLCPEWERLSDLVNG